MLVAIVPGGGVQCMYVGDETFKSVRFMTPGANKDALPRTQKP